MNSRELDILVAERVMGVYVLEHDIYNLEYVKEKPSAKRQTLHPLPYYSTNIAAAQEILNKLYTCDFCLDRTQGVYRCNFGLQDKYEEWVSAETLPLAICLAALKAVGVSVK